MVRRFRLCLLELSWRAPALLQTTVTPIIPPGMPNYARPSIIEPLTREYEIEDLTPFAPGETRIYRVRKAGFLLAEKNSGTLTASAQPQFAHQEKAQQEITKKTTLEAYPNPTEESATLSFSLQKEQHIRLQIYNTLGQQLQMVFEGRVKAGDAKFVCSLSSLPNGVYWVRLFTDNGTFTVPITKR